MADPAEPGRLTVRFDYHFDRLLATKLERAYALLVPDPRWPVRPATAEAPESDHEHPGRDLRARVLRSSA